MSNVAVINNNQPAALAHQATWTEADVMAVKNLIAPNATPEDMKLFLYTATQRGLNPLLKQIYCIHRGGKMSLQTGIDGYRLIANRTGKLKGIERGVKYNEKGELYAWAKVYRSDWTHPAYEEVALKEYRGNTPTWSNMPETMLKKVAEAAALRMAFPEDLSGLYTQDEMDQADNPAPGPVSRQEVVDAAQRVHQVRDIGVEEQKKIKEIGAAIKSLMKELGLSQQDVTELTGYESLKGLDSSELEEVLITLQGHQTKVEYLESEPVEVQQQGIL